MAADTMTGWPVMSIEQANKLITSPGQNFELGETVVNEVTYRTYVNAPPTLLQIFQLGRMYGDRIYHVHEDERVSFLAHNKASIQLAHDMIDLFGIRKGDRVAIAMRNYPEWPVAFFAAMLAGAIVTPLNSWWTGEELRYGLSDSGAKLLVCDQQIFERMREHRDDLPQLENVIIVRDSEERADPRVASMDGIIGEVAGWSTLADKPMPDVALAPDDDVTIMYTSGTTGKPKGAVASHRAIISNMLNSIACQARTILRRGEMPPEPDIDNPRIALVAIPFFHATGAFAIMIPTLALGQRFVSMHKWDTVRAMELIERERITTVGGVPTIAWQLLEHPDRDKHDLSSINQVSYGGAPSAPELVATIGKRFPGAVPGNGWGMTETCATATLNTAEDYVHRPTSAGCPGPAVDLKIVGADGQTLPVGEIGELWCKGPMNCRAYWNKPEASATTFVDGWVVTGDLARLDEEGFLYIVDRAKDMVIRGGENVYSIEVENVMFEHEAISDAAVVGVPHKVLGEEVGVVVMLRPGASLTAEELRHFAARHLAAFKVPAHVIFTPEPLPRNANGKVLKNELRKLFAPA